MQNNQNNATGQATSLVVNEARLPQTVKRFFKNSVAEIVGELLQNAQRAGATRVCFETADDKLTVADDGHGLAEQDESWAKLLRIADSFYADGSIENNQKPMGLGFLSLLACEAVRYVRISSGNRSVLIDTERLWNEASYWQNWTKRIVESDPQRVNGFRLEIETVKEADFVKQAKAALEPKTLYYQEYGAAEGYEGILEVSCDGQPVRTAVPADYRIKEANLLFETEYQGNAVRVGTGREAFGTDAKNGVIWYGQIIPFLKDFAFHFVLHVRTGSPLNPLAPTRAGIIDDGKAADFKAFLTEEVFRFAASAAGRRRLDLKMAKALFALDAPRTARELDICIIRRVVTDDLENMQGAVEFAGERHTSIFHSDSSLEEVLTATELAEETTDATRVVLVGETVLVEGAESVGFGAPATGRRELYPSDYGLASFEASVRAATGGGEFYFFVAGDARRADIRTVVWRPGASRAAPAATGDAGQNIFVGPGEFALVPQAKIPEQGGVIHEIEGHLVVPRLNETATAEMFDLQTANWQKPTTPVWIFEYAENWSIASTEGLTVGIEPDRAQWAQWVKDYAWTCFSETHDEESADTLRAAFERSVTEFVIKILGDTLQKNFDFDEVCGAVLTVVRRGDEKAVYADVARNIAALIPLLPDQGEKGDGKLEVLMKSGEKHIFALYA